jgi:hypothetical protein
MSSQTWRKGIGLSALVALLTLAGCKQNSGREALIEKPIPVTPIPVQKAVEPPPKLPPPQPVEVESAIHRIFRDDLLLDQGDGQWFIVGDFNGDNIEDVAVIARVNAGKVDDINGELANWTIQDADKFFVAAGGQRAVKVPRMDAGKLGRGEQVLVIIHGYGPRGWRGNDARQAYVLRHAAGTFVGLAPNISEKSIRLMHLPVRSDIIKEIRDNKKGFLFWTGGAYAWHPDSKG